MTGNPQLIERQETLLGQARNCRDLAHFLRTDPRVEGHFDMDQFFYDPQDVWGSSADIERNPKVLHKCGTTACGGGWAIYLRLAKNIDDLPNAFGVQAVGGDIFGTTPRTPQEEALVLEDHAERLEARV